MAALMLADSGFLFEYGHPRIWPSLSDAISRRQSHDSPADYDDIFGHLDMIGDPIAQETYSTSGTNT